MEPEQLTVKDPNGYPVPGYDRPPPMNPNMTPGAYQQQQPPPFSSSMISYQGPPQQVFQQQAPFDDNAPKYRCCGCCHSTCGSITIGILEIIAAVGGFGFSFASNYFSGYRPNITSGVVPLVITCLIVALMFYGIRATKCGFLIAHMVYQIMAIISCCIILILGIVALVGSTKVENVTTNGLSINREDAKDVVQFIGILAVSLGVIGACLEIWFFIVVLKCYRYLRDKRIYMMISVHPIVGFGMAPQPQMMMVGGGQTVMAVY